MSTLEEILAREGRILSQTRGVSMESMLRQNRDVVIIEVPSGPLKPLDVAFYRRGSDHVRHRVIRVGEGYYLIRGDNTYALERVPQEDVLGVLTGFVRKKRFFSTDHRGYQIYVHVWNALYPLRRFYVLLRRRAIQVARRLGLLPLLKRLLKRA